MFRSIMLAHDGTEFSRHALPWAIAAAGRAGGPRAELRIVHVPAPYVPPAAATGDALLMASQAPPSDHGATRRMLDELAARVREATGLTVTAAVEEEGRAADALRRHGRAHGVDLVVMATHARGGVARAVLGSVADEMVRESGLPVLLTRPPAEGAAPPAAIEPAPVRRVLVTLDGGPRAEAILPHARSLCEATGAACALLRIVEPMLTTGILAPPALVDEEAERENLEAAGRYLDGLAARLGRGLAVTTRVLGGRAAAPAIVEQARAEEADLVALATHGRKGLARALAGSTEGALLQKLTVPLLVVREG